MRGRHLVTFSSNDPQSAGITKLNTYGFNLEKAIIMAAEAVLYQGLRGSHELSTVRYS